jgi:thiol-disulfide isomerase/thioredoxin
MLAAPKPRRRRVFSGYFRVSVVSTVRFSGLLDVERRRLRRYDFIPMRMLGFSVLAVLVAAASVHADSAADQRVRDAIKAPELTVIHLWAPWCSNCQAELKNGGWLKMAKENPKTKFIFVSVWNNGNDGRSMLERFGLANQPNVTITADPGPRSGEGKIKEFAGLPISWIPTTWIYKGGDLRYALNYGEVRFPVLQQFLEDSESEWSHKGEPKLEE